MTRLGLNYQTETISKLSVPVLVLELQLNCVKTETSKSEINLWYHKIYLFQVDY